MPPIKMVVVAQLVRAPDCGSGGRRFEPGLPPVLKLLWKQRSFFFWEIMDCGKKRRPGEKPVLSEVDFGRRSRRKPGLPPVL